MKQYKLRKLQTRRHFVHDHYLVGIDPARAYSSGTSVTERPCISRVGNVRLRRVLYMPALVAIRHEEAD